MNCKYTTKKVNKSIETNNIFKQDAKSLVDTLFETKIFRDDLTRDELNSIEEMIDYYMSSRFYCIKRAEKLFNKVIEKELEEIIKQ